MNYVISIINPEALGALTEICEKLSLPLTVTLHGRGTAMQGMLDLLGIESNEKRVVLTVANEEKTAQLIAAQRRYLHLGVPGHGFVIAIPIKSVGGGKAVAYMKNIILGVVGGVIGSVLLRIIGIHASGFIGGTIVSIIGACILVWLARKLL